MKSTFLKYTAPIGLGLGLFIITFFASSYTGCEKETPASTSGCGTQMGCCPATGCGRNWLGNVTQLCYATSSACNSAGNNRCTQCY